MGGLLSTHSRSRARAYAPGGLQEPYVALHAPCKGLRERLGRLASEAARRAGLRGPAPAAPRHQGQQQGGGQLAPAGGAAAGHGADGPAAPQAEAAKAARPRQRPTLDPADYTFSHLRGATRVKPPGSVNGQQFAIEDCKGCSLFVLDACAAVTVDDCADCRILVGPTESSVFLRNCSGCRVVCVSGQLRVRDCAGCDLLLRVRTRPVVESSSGLQLGCFAAAYAGLAAQMKAAGISPLHNFWSEVFDFTPPARGQPPPWRPLPACEGAGALGRALGPLPACVRALTEAAAGGEPRAEPVGGDRLECCSCGCGASGAAAQAVGGPSAEDRRAAIATAGLGKLQGAVVRGGFCFLLFPPGRSGDALRWAHEQFAPCTSSSCSCDPSAGADEWAECDSGSAQAGGSCVASGPDSPPAPAAGAAVTAAPAAAAEAPAGASPRVAALLPSPPLLLHTNKAQVPAEALRQMAAAAGWTKAEQRRWASAASGGGQQACGLEVACGGAEQRAAVVAAATAAMPGVLESGSEQAAGLFHHLGVDG